MKTRRIALVLIALMLVFSLFACGGDGSGNGGDDTGATTCTSHTDANRDGVCDTVGCNEPVACTNHADANNDGKCDTVGCTYEYTCTTHADTDNDGKCDNAWCGACTKHTDRNKDGVCDTTGCNEAVPCTTHVDKNGDNLCDREYCGEPLECKSHVDADADGVCDKAGCDAAVPCTSHTDADFDGVCDKSFCNVAVPCTNHIDENRDGVCDRTYCDATVEIPCTDHVDQDFDGICDSDNCTEAVACTDHIDEDKDGVCDRTYCDGTVELPVFDENGNLILFRNGVPTFKFVTGTDIGSNLAKVNELVTILNGLSAKTIAVENYSSTEQTVEILVGTVKTRGTEYNLNKYDYGMQGYVVKQVGTKIIVLGGSDDMLVSAINHLKEKVFEIKRTNDDFTDFVMTSAKAYEYKQDGYLVSNITLLGESIKDYVFTYEKSNNTGKSIAEYLQQYLYENCGIRIEAVRSDKLSASQRYVMIKLI